MHRTCLGPLSPNWIFFQCVVVTLLWLSMSCLAKQVKKWASNSMPAAMRPQTENYIVSRYIEDPLLIGGKKFDLRIYVVVLNYKPLQVMSQ